MESVVDFITDSLNFQTDTTPIVSGPPSFLKQSSEARTVQESIYPLTPLESQMKDIIVSVYGANPALPPSVTKSPQRNNSSYTESDSNTSHILKHIPSDLSPQSSDLNYTATLLPIHVMSKDPLKHTRPSESSVFMPDEVPVNEPSFFTPDEVPVNKPLPPPPLLFPQISAISSAGSSTSKVVGEPNRPFALRTAPIHSSNVDSLSLVSHSIFSPTDFPLINNSSNTPSHSAYSENKFPGFPRRVNEQSTNVTECVSVENEPGIINRSISSTPISMQSYIQDSSSHYTPVPPRMPAHVKTARHIMNHQSSNLPVTSTPPLSQVLPSLPVTDKVSGDDTSTTVVSPQDKHSEPQTVGSFKLPGRVTRAPSKYQPLKLETNPLVKPGIHLSSPISHTIQRKPISEDLNDLKQQIQQLVKLKANLEGQLESVVNECQTTLRDRAQLQLKLSRAETELKMVQEKTAKASWGKKTPVVIEEEGSDLTTEVNRLEAALRKKRQEMAVMNKEIRQHRDKLQQMNDESISTKQVLQSKELSLLELESSTASFKKDVEEKTDQIQELGGCVANLEAALESTESANSWLHDQLQDAIQSKLKLQEELKKSRVTSIGQSVSMEQLDKENALLKQQIGELRNSILKDKAHLVSELEAIEADVLSKESSYVELQADKEHLEQLIQLKTQQLEHLGSQVAEHEAGVADLENKLVDAEHSCRMLTSQVNKLEDENKKLNSSLQHGKQFLVSKEKELEDVKKAKSNLHQQLQRAEATLVSKEGTLQGLKDSREIMRQELEGVKEARENAEVELANAHGKLAKLETELESTETMLQNEAAELNHVKNMLQQRELLIDALKSQLLDKQEELDEKRSVLVNIEDQSSDLRDQFQSLQSKFRSITDESGVGLAEKDHMINHLMDEKERMDCEIKKQRAENKELTGTVNQLKEKNAHLQGELDSSLASVPTLEDLKGVYQEKNSLESQLASERMSHQHELIKRQAKIARLETEIKDAMRDRKKREEELKEELLALQRELEMRDSIPVSNQEVLSTVPIDVTDEISSLQSQLEDKERELVSFKEKQKELEEENDALREVVNEESNRIFEVERASSLVAQQLKENALIAEERLKDEVQELVIETERLKGHLTGINRAQMCLREHATALESDIAQKEVQLSQLTSETTSLLAEKEREIDELKTCAENKLGSLKTELEKALTDVLLEKQRADDLRRQLLDSEDHLKSTDTTCNEIQALQGYTDELEKQKGDLQAEIRTLKQQLAIAQTNYDGTRRSLQEKNSLVNILQQELQLSQVQVEESQEEIRQLRDHTLLTEEKYKTEIDYLNRAVSDLQYSLLSTTEYTGMDTNDTGEFGYLEDQQDNDEPTSQLNDQNSIYTAQVQELRSRLEKARNEGQEVGEKRSLGEISALRTQLGTKSRTLRNLNGCLTSLKDDMSRMQAHMDQHSVSLTNSYRSSREIESKIDDLRRSQSESGHVSPYPTSSTPTKQLA